MLPQTKNFSMEEIIFGKDIDDTKRSIRKKQIVYGDVTGYHPPRSYW